LGAFSTQLSASYNHKHSNFTCHAHDSFGYNTETTVSYERMSVGCEGVMYEFIPEHGHTHPTPSAILTGTTHSSTTTTHTSHPQPTVQHALFHTYTPDTILTAATHDSHYESHACHIANIVATR
jgi:hypothetical protein